tara:strand:- start:403 stop:561 length:159 start_codon:yes stop_codon:yes gene_type:complete
MNHIIKIIETQEIWDFATKEDAFNFSNNLGESHTIYSVDSNNDCEEIKTIWL